MRFCRSLEGRAATGLAALLLSHAAAAEPDPSGLRLRLSPTLAAAPAPRNPEPDRNRPAQRQSAPLLLRREATLVAAAGGAQAPRRLPEVLLEVTVNGESLGESALVLQTPEGDVLVPEALLGRARLTPPASPALVQDGTPHYSLRGLRGIRFTVDPATQTLAVTADPEAFESYTSVIGAQRTRATPSALGGFVNYDLLGLWGPERTEYSGLFELGVFGKWGVLTSTEQVLRVESRTRWTRLETTWRMDNPEAMTTLRVGDSINNPGLWGSALRFGGVQYGRDFATQPRFVTFPLPTLKGDALVPSAVDLYFNDALVARRDVPPGPFAIENVPTITGQGELRMVVKDAAGREQVIVQPIYSSINLLKEGLTDFSYEAGWLRRDFGLRSNEYGPFAGSATYRRGLSDVLTGELHAQASGQQQTAGVAADYVIQPYAAVNAALAASHGDPGWGSLFNLGGSAQFGRLNLSALASLQSGEFRQVGQDPRLPPPSTTVAASVGYGSANLGNLSLGYARSENRVGPELETVLASYQLPLMRRAFFQALAVRTLSPIAGTTLTFSLNIPFGPPDALHTLDVAYQSQKQGDRREDDTFITLTRNLPAGPGYGYRLQTTASGDSRFGELGLQTDFGTYAFSVQDLQGRQAKQALASGGVGLVGGHAFASRRIIDSFGLVEVPGVAGARVTADGQLIGRTSDDGTLLVPTLRAYDINRITVEPGDIPLDAVVEKVQLDVVPYARSGVEVRFPIKRTRGATARLVLENGQPVPSGAMARVAGVETEFTVALDGAVYLTDLQASNEVTVSWAGRSCRLTLALPETADPLPELGTLTCREVGK